MKKFLSRAFSHLQDEKMEWIGRGMIFLLFLGGLFTLPIHITDDHAWRQSIGLMISQNFLTEGFSLFYPHYDICDQHSPDIIAGEFPLMNSLVAVFMKVFGKGIFWSRLVNWIISSFGLYFFFKIAKEITNYRVALVALIFLIGSNFTMFARKVMPDTFSLSLCFIGLYALVLFLKRGKNRDLMIGTFFCILGVLCKVPSLVVLSLLVYFFFRKEIMFKRKIYVSGAMVSLLTIVYFWYFQWVPHLETLTGCPRLMYPVSLSEGFKIFTENLEKTHSRFLYDAFKWPIPYFFALGGIVTILIRKKFLLGFTLFVYSIVFLLFIMKSGNVFLLHTYYILPFVPVMCILIGVFFDSKYIVSIIGILAIIGMQYFPIKSNMDDVYLGKYPHYVKIEGVLNNLDLAESDLIMVNGGILNPTFMYFTRRKGWTVNNNILEKINWMKDYKRDGMKYIVVDRRKYNKSLPYKKLYEDEDFAVYEP